MNNLHVDFAVIGAGTAGLAAFRAAKSHGKSGVLIEGGPYGTTCARVGCMPSKLLIAAAEAAHAISHAPGFGVHADNLRIDGRAVMARVRAERDRFVGFVIEGVERIPESERLRGQAHFLAPNRLQVDGHTIVHAERIVIATGSRPQIPAQLRDAGKRLVVNDDVFEWQDLPESVAVIGTGVIGLELGQALHRLGVRVAVFGRSARIAQLTDPEVTQAAARALGQELDLRCHATILSAHETGEHVQLRYRDSKGTEHTEQFRYVLAAAGRMPDVGQLGLENTGLELDAHGVPRFDAHTMQCGSSAIFIAGDANHERPLLHEAADQGRIAGDNAALFPAVRPGLRRSPLNIAFTEPQIVVAGQSFAELPAKLACGVVSFEDQGRSRVMRQNRGLLRVYGEYGSMRFLGAEMAGPRAEHLGHLLAWAHQNQMTVPAMLEMPFYHPVIEEGLRTALRDLNEKLQRGLPEIDHCTDCTPGM
jgi:dihydrolipoamide dehydrogenase